MVDDNNVHLGFDVCSWWFELVGPIKPVCCRHLVRVLLVACCKAHDAFEKASWTGSIIPGGTAIPTNSIKSIIRTGTHTLWHRRLVSLPKEEHEGTWLGIGWCLNIEPTCKILRWVKYTYPLPASNIPMTRSWGQKSSWEGEKPLHKNTNSWRIRDSPHNSRDI